MFGFASWKIIAGMAVIMALLSGGFYLYFQWSQEQLRIAAENQAKLELVVEETKKAIEFQNKAIKLQTSRLNSMNKDVNQIRKSSMELQKLFSRHNFGELVRKKPRLLESKQNKATQKLFDEFEQITDPETYDD